MSHEDMVKNMKMLQTEAESNLRAEFERRVQEIEARYADKMRIQREELELKRKTELHEVEERKNTQVLNLTKSHEQVHLVSSTLFKTVLFSEILNWGGV